MQLTTSGATQATRHLHRALESLRNPSLSHPRQTDTHPEVTAALRFRAYSSTVPCQGEPKPIKPNGYDGCNRRGTEPMKDSNVCSANGAHEPEKSKPRFACRKIGSLYERLDAPTQLRLTSLVRRRRGRRHCQVSASGRPIILRSRRLECKRGRGRHSPPSSGACQSQIRYWILLVARCASIIAKTADRKRHGETSRTPSVGCMIRRSA